MATTFDTEDTRPSPSGESGVASLVLLAISRAGVIPVVLPAQGSFIVGRSRESDLQLTDEQVSRRHLQLHLGAEIHVEDLGSRNGTRCRGRRLAPGERLQVMAGDAIEVGHHTLVLRPAEAGALRTVCDERYLRTRLTEECARADRLEWPFALLALRFLSGHAAPGIALVGGLLRPSDTLSLMDRGDLCIALLPGARPNEAAAIRDRALDKLNEQGLSVHAALACHPLDGGDTTTLLSRLEDGVSGEREAPQPVGQAPEMQVIHELIARVAPSGISILILGETGVGKDVIAQRAHQLSPRAGQQFLRLNCGALSETLLESELFGYERGAFTGAVKAKPGLLESAQGGTVFLDEIGELPLHLQVKLLEVLETRQVTRVGGLRARPIDVRFLSATNRDLHQEVAQGRFRQDLLFRLEGVVVRVPPLRERRDDILPLARTFIAQAAHDLGRPPPAIGPDAERHLMTYAWPGNVRELRNAIARAVLLCGERIEPDHLARPLLDDTVSSEEARDKQRIIAALEQCAGNQTRAARLLGIARSTLVLRLDAYGIPRPRR
jgi:two-component system, NtrC family, response regulator AtoC